MISYTSETREAVGLHVLQSWLNGTQVVTDDLLTLSFRLYHQILVVHTSAFGKASPISIAPNIHKLKHSGTH